MALPSMFSVMVIHIILMGDNVKTITVSELKSLLGKIKLIDLRSNTGGMLKSVVKMIDFMVGEGLIVKVTDKNDKVIEEYYSDKNEFNGEIVVLTNSYTASASELFSQPMRDYNKAKLVGTTTFGKGTVISTYALTNGGSITLSTGLYTTKSGAFLEGNGIEPDYYIELDPGIMDDSDNYKNDTQIMKALEVLGVDNI